MIGTAAYQSLAARDPIAEQADDVYGEALRVFDDYLEPRHSLASREREALLREDKAA